jgi:hypothetical protein
MNYLKKFLFIILLVLFSSCLDNLGISFKMETQVRSNGSIAGTVSRSDVNIPDIPITVYSAEYGTYNLTTDENGSFYLDDLWPGEYTITATWDEASWLKDSYTVDIDYGDTIENIDFVSKVNWVHIYSPYQSSTDMIFTDIIQNDDKSFTLCGYINANSYSTSDTNTDNDLLFVKLSEFGSFEYSSVLGGSEDDIPLECHLLSDDSLLVIGNSSSADGSSFSTNGLFDGFLLSISPGEDDFTVNDLEMVGSANEDRIIGMGINASNDELYLAGYTQYDGLSKSAWISEYEYSGSSFSEVTIGSEADIPGIVLTSYGLYSWFSDIIPVYTSGLQSGFAMAGGVVSDDGEATTMYNISTASTLASDITSSYSQGDTFSTDDQAVQLLQLSDERMVAGIQVTPNSYTDGITNYVNLICYTDDVVEDDRQVISIQDDANLELVKMILTSNNNIALCINKTVDGAAAVLFKVYTSDFQTLVSKEFSLDDYNGTVPTSLIETNDGGFLISGYINASFKQGFLIRLDQSYDVIDNNIDTENAVEVEY